MATQKNAIRLIALVALATTFCMGFEPLCDSAGSEPLPGPKNKLVALFIGRWITEGQTIAGANASSVKIHSSDIYEWAPGGFFVVHTAYGRIGSVDAGGVEIISYDKATGKYQSHFYDSQGNIRTDQLSVNGNVWKWQGKKTRCTGVFSENGKILTAHHERSDDGVHWVPSMDVILTKVE